MKWRNLIPLLASLLLAASASATLPMMGGRLSVVQTLDMDADFAARATAANVLYALNFEDVYVNSTIQPSRKITTQVELADESISISDGSWAGGHTEALQHITRETTIKRSGSASMRFNTVSTDTAAGGSWAFRPNGTDATVYRRLYIQLAVYYPKETIGYCYATTTTPQLKVINFGQAGNGQLVLSNFRMVGFPSGFINQSDGMIASNTGNEFGTPNAFSHTLQHIQDAIDAGGATTTQTDLLTRYGPLTGSGVSNGMDTDCTTGSKFLYLKTQPAGFPDTRAATHGIPFYNDDWTVLEVYLQFTAGDASSVQMWAARYGDQPTLIISDIGNLPLGLSSGGNDNSWSRFEILNYDTSRDTEVGRPTMFTYYTEVIVSEAPINFPGGFTIPNNQGAANEPEYQQLREVWTAEPMRLAA